MNDFASAHADDDSVSSDDTSVPHPLFLLVLSRVCFDFSKRYVRQAVELGASMFPVHTSIRRKKDGRDLAATAADRAELTDMDELVVTENCKNIRECGEV